MSSAPVIDEYVTRNYLVPLDANGHQDRLLNSYCGAHRFCWNWLLAQVKENLDTRASERAVGVAADGLTPALSWSRSGLERLWKAHRDEVAPWWGEVSMHAFRSAAEDLARALANWSGSRKGTRKGRPVGFPGFRSRRHTKKSVRFVEINHQMSWLSDDRRGVRLMLPVCLRGGSPRARRMVESLQWLRTRESTRRVYKLVESGRATIQAVTLKWRGGRWWATFTLRITDPRHVPHAKRYQHKGGIVGIDVGSRYLATTSEPVPGLTDDEGHVTNPRPLASNLARLAKLDRAISRCQPGSKNRRRLLGRRARLHGKITQQRQTYLDRVSAHLADRFDVVVIEGLNVAGMATRKGRLGRAISDAAVATLHAQLTYKCSDRGRVLVEAPRFYPSSKTCSRCHAVRAKLHRNADTFECDTCGLRIDRDLNAARNLRQWGAGRLAAETAGHQLASAGTRPASGAPPGS